MKGRRRLEAGDHENEAFAVIGPDAHHVKPGFDAGGEVSEDQKGAVRYPHRRKEDEVPKASLADRLRDEWRRRA
jgi:hypothetical protein